MSVKNTKYLFDERKTPENMVSVSQLQTFLSCKKKWEYDYIERLKPRVERSYLTIGKLCHKGMQITMQELWKHPDLTLSELTYCGILAIREMGEKYMEETPMLDEEVPDFEQMRKDAEEIFTQAVAEFDPCQYEVITVIKDGKPAPALELHFCVPCPPTKGLHGFIDAILKSKKTGFVWCTDYKFRKSLSPDEEEAFNIQNAVYSYACSKMGIDITGTMTWQHVNTPAAEPQVLKTGAISRAKIRTTWIKYMKCCLEHGEDPANYYEEMAEKLSDIEWYRPTYEYRNEETIKNMWKECVLPVAKAVKQAATSKSACNYRSLYPWNCKMCQYQSLCQAELRNYDADAIRIREYTKHGSVSPAQEEASSLASETSDE